MHGAPGAAVPEAFAGQGVTAEEYAQYGLAIKAVKKQPPEKLADEKTRDVQSFLNELAANWCIYQSIACNTYFDFTSLSTRVFLCSPFPPVGSQ